MTMLHLIQQEKELHVKTDTRYLKIVDSVENVFSILEKGKQASNCCLFQRVKHFWLALGHASHFECLSLKTHFIEPHLASFMLMKVFLLIASHLGYKTIGLETDID